MPFGSSRRRTGGLIAILIVAVLTFTQLLLIGSPTTMKIYVVNHQNNETQIAAMSAVNVKNHNNASIIAINNNHSHSTEKDPYWWTLMLASPESLEQDLRITGLSCGFWKCYFPSLTHYGQFGYLIGQRRSLHNRHAQEFTYKNLLKAYELAIQLEKNYGMKHLMESPPIVFNCTTSLERKLNQGIDILKARGRRYQEPFRETLSRHLKRDRLIVQAVKQAPIPNIVRRLGGIVKNNKLWDDKMKKLFQNHVQNPETFWNTFLSDWNKTQKGLKAEPGLYNDFQFLWDAQGNMYHMDLDRIWGNTVQSIQGTQQNIQKYLLDSLEQGIQSRIWNNTNTAAAILVK